MISNVIIINEYMNFDLNPIEKHKSEIERRISMLEQKFKEVPVASSRKKGRKTMLGEANSMRMTRTNHFNMISEGQRQWNSEEE